MNQKQKADTQREALRVAYAQHAAREAAVARLWAAFWDAEPGSAQQTALQALADGEAI